MLSTYSFALLGLVSLVAADYYIDNANSTVSYAASGTTWQTYSLTTRNLTFITASGNITVDSSKCYDQNYDLAACTVNNNCQITFPFTGSGITVYVLHAGFQGISASLTVDNGQPVTATLPAPAPPTYQTPNVSLFDVQSLASADHSATINLLDWQGSTTSLYFDYAFINQSYVEFPAPSATTTTQSLTTQSTTPSSTSPITASALIGSTLSNDPTSAVSSSNHSGVNVAVVVGSTCGGVAGLIVIVTAIIFLRRHRSRRTKSQDIHNPNSFPPAPALVRDQTVPSSAYRTMDEMTRNRVAAARNAALYQSSRVQSDGESSDWNVLSAASSAGRAPNARPSINDPFSPTSDGSIADSRREGSLMSDARGSVDGNQTFIAGTINMSRHSLE